MHCIIKLWSDAANNNLRGEETVTLLHLDHCSILDGAQLRVAVKRDVPQPEREACAVAGDLVLHERLGQLSHQHLTPNLYTEQRGRLHDCICTTVSTCSTSPNLKFEAFCCRRLNPDVKGGIPRIRYIRDAVINTLMEAASSALLSLSERS